MAFFLLYAISTFYDVGHNSKKGGEAEITKIRIQHPCRRKNLTQRITNLRKDEETKDE